MPRKAKGVHTSPETAGVQNMPENYIETHQDEEKTMKKLMPIWDRGFKNRQDYKGQWTEEAFANEINEYFKYCFDHDVKTSKAGLALWMGTHKQPVS